MNDVISMTDNEATTTTFVRTRPALHEDEDEAEAGCYEAEAEHFGLEATLRPRWPGGLTIHVIPFYNQPDMWICH